jgi:CubicO group peptidase (beta-lactamase class C family)
MRPNFHFRLFCQLAVIGVMSQGTILAADSAIPSDGGLQKIVQPYIDHHTTSGLVVLVASKDRILDLEAVGYADLANHKPMEPDAIFAIASMGKSMAAVSIMMLAEAGKLSVEDPVEKYLPEFKNEVVIDPAHPDRTPSPPLHSVTIRNLLTHTSGLPYSTPEEKPTLDGRPLREAALFYAHAPLHFEPGTQYLYSNAGINTAARIVEVVSGMPYEEFLQKRLFGPLGMTDTTYWPTEEQLQRHPTFYKTNAAKTGLEPTLPARFTYPLSDRMHRFPIAGSGLFSTATDMVKFCQMILNDGTYAGKTYLSKASIAQMTSKQTPPAISEFYGFGWDVAKDGSSFGHNGSFNTAMRIFPSQNLVVICLEQLEGPRPDKSGDQILPDLLKAATDKFGSNTNSRSP